MGKIVMLVPGEHIREWAEKLYQSVKNRENLIIKIAHMDQAVEEARKLDAKEVDVLIARGDTARLLKSSNLLYPVIDIGISEENVVKSITQAIELSGKEDPCIAIIGLESLVNRVKAFFAILRPKIRFYTASSRENIRNMVKKSQQDGADVIIGGLLTCSFAAEHGLKYVLTTTTYEQVFSAYERALDIQKSLEQERKKNTEIKAIFDTVTDGIVSIGKNGIVTMMNIRAQEILERTEGHLKNLPMENLFGVEKCRQIKDVMQTGERITGSIIRFGDFDYAMNVIPVDVEGNIKGAIVTLSRVNDIQKMETKIRKGLYLKGNTADYTFADIIGESKNIKDAIRQAKIFAPLDSHILIIGDTGTGKELFAQSIHNESGRSAGPFVAVNCGSIPDNLLESELFGYVDGTFTGARKGGKIGYFELAHNGTIFLDEISEMSPAGQVGLLRVIQEQEVRRVGSDSVIPINVRIIAASNVNLYEMVKDRKFRKDLY